MFCTKKNNKNGLRRKNQKHYTEEEAETERQYQITVEMARLAEIERFFHSDWYSQLCNINGDKMIEGAKEKYKRTRFMKKLRRIKKYKWNRGIRNARLKKTAV